jgi:hypothetical protein
MNILTGKHSSKTNNNHLSEEEPKGTQIMPYASVISEILRIIGNKFGIRITFESSFTLRSILTKTKLPNQLQESKNYNISCE